MTTAKDTTWSRPVVKPFEKDSSTYNNVVDAEREALEKIDYLRKKMRVQEKREQVIRIENYDTSSSTAELIQNLVRENEGMYSSLSDALSAEHETVKNALRTHPEFQMAMSNKGSEEAILWLEDKIFDLEKVVNVLYSRMLCKKSEIDKIEAMVLLMEKFPRPGSSAVDSELQERADKLQLQIELAIYRRDTAYVLREKYYEVQDEIEKENIHHEVLLREMENKLEALLEEQRSMDNILCVAQKFKKQMLRDLEEYEQAYYENQKQRKRQLHLKRKQIDKKLKEELKRANDEPDSEGSPRYSQSDSRKLYGMHDLEVKLSHKLDICQKKISNLMDVMRVKSFDQVIHRMRQVLAMNEKLRSEADIKTSLKSALEKERETLSLIKCHIKYTGVDGSTQYEQKKTALEADREAIEKEVQIIQRKINHLGEATQDAYMGMFTVLKKLGDKTRAVQPYRHRVKTMFTLMEKLKDDLVSARQDVSHLKKPPTALIKSLKPVKPEKRLVRVGTPHVSDEEDDLEEAEISAGRDRSVPNREALKERNLRFLKRAAFKKRLVD